VKIKCKRQPKEIQYSQFYYDLQVEARETYSITSRQFSESNLIKDGGHLPEVLMESAQLLEQNNEILLFA